MIKVSTKLGFVRKKTGKDTAFWSIKYQKHIIKCYSSPQAKQQGGLLLFYTPKVSYMIRFAIIGHGNIGSRHAHHIEQHPEAELVAVCDKNPAQLARYAADKVFTTTDFNAILDRNDIDVVNVCLPNYLHAPCTSAALEKGKHVVCEKPMAMSVSECSAMIHAAEVHNKQLFVVKQNRYNPPVQAVKQLVEQGALGAIYQVQINCFWNRNERYYTQSDWRGSRSKDGGCLFTQCSHFVDIMYYLIGNVLPIKGLVHNFGHEGFVEFEDSGAFILQAANNGALVSFCFSTCTHQKNMEGSITIIAEHGTVKIGGQYLNTIEYQNIANHHIILPDTGNSCNDYGEYQGSMSNHDKVIQNVVDTLLQRDTVATNGQEGRQIVAIIEGMYGVVG